jgi:hypothetical protein
MRVPYIYLPLPLLLMGALVALGCDPPLPNPSDLQDDSGRIKNIGATSSDEGKKPPSPPVEWNQPPALGEPWTSWGIRPFNGTTRMVSETQIVIAFGARQPIETLVDLYRSRLKAHGWEVLAAWQDGTRQALSMKLKQIQICLLFSPSETTEPSIVLVEIPGPEARLGSCEENSALPVLTIADLTPGSTQTPK